MYWIVTCLLIFLVFSPLQAAETEQPPCENPEVWTDWEVKASQHVGNLDFQALHALWMGLCMKVKSGGLTEEEADGLFERARNTLLQQRREERSQQPMPPAL